MARTREEWNEIAAQLANSLNEALFEAHRGALMVGEHIYAVFGNDCYAADIRSQHQVNMFSNALNGAMPYSEALGFGTSDNGYTWVLLIFNSPIVDNVTETKNRLTEMIWREWRIAHGGERVSRTFEAIQRSVAEQAISEYEARAIVPIAC